VKTGDIESPWERKLEQVKRKPLLTPALHVRVSIQLATTSNPEGWMDGWMDGWMIDIWTEKHFFMVFLSQNYVLTMVNYVLIIFNRHVSTYLVLNNTLLTYLPTYIESTYIPYSYLLYIIITNLFFWVQFSDVASIMNIPRGI